MFWIQKPLWRTMIREGREMTYLPKPEQAWQLLSDQQKKLYPLEMMLSDVRKANQRYPKSNTVYLDVDCFRVWDSNEKLKYAFDMGCFK